MSISKVIIITFQPVKGQIVSCLLDITLTVLMNLIIGAKAPISLVFR